MLKVGMIGAGIISASHLAAVANHPDTCLAAVADLVEEKAHQAAEPYGARVYTDYEAMLAQEPLDLAIINLPHGLHEACVLACAGRGVHRSEERRVGDAGSARVH